MAVAALRLDYGPVATTKLDGELFGRYMYELLWRGPSPFCNRARPAWAQPSAL